MAADDDIHGATTKRPPPSRGSVVVQQGDVESYRVQAGRERKGQLWSALEKALAVAAVALVAGATARLTAPGSVFGPPKEEAPKPSKKKPKEGEGAKEGEEKEEAQPPTNEELKEQIDLLQTAVLRAESRANACVAVVNDQAWFWRSYHRTVNGISIPIKGEPGEAPILAIGPSPLSTKPFVFEIGPPRLVVQTPIPTVPKD